MNFNSPNNKKVTLTIRRRELCRLILACTSLYSQWDEPDRQSWKLLHDHLKETLNRFDEKEASAEGRYNK